MAISEIFVTVVCTVRNAEDHVERSLTRLAGVLGNHLHYYEILVIDNASSDRTGTLVNDVLKREKNIQYCLLSGGKSETIALAAGLDRALGDFIIMMDLLVDPPELIPELVELASSGADVVYALPRQRVSGGSAYDRLARLFLKFIARCNGVDVPHSTSTYRLFSRSVLNYILEASDYHRTISLAPALSGYGYKTVEYDRIATNSGNQRRISRKDVYRALDLVFSTSVRPLRFVTLMSLGICLLTLVYAIYVVIVKLVMEDVAPGWAALSLQVSVLFFLLSMVLAVMCEYLLQVLETSNRRPVYHVARESQSSVMDYQHDLNVVESRQGSGPGRRFLRETSGNS